MPSAVEIEAMDVRPDDVIVGLGKVLGTADAWRGTSERVIHVWTTGGEAIYPMDQRISVERHA